MTDPRLGRSTTYDYDAFVSYSTAADRDLSATIQHEIERMGLPPYRRRRIRIFRDFTSLSADASLQRVIEENLARSRRFILLLSPEAARSPWVGREVRWWREHRSADDVILVLTSGTIRWDETRGDWDWTDDPPLPPALRGMFSAEPLWVDLSDQKERDGRSTRSERELARLALLHGCAAIAAPLRSMDKDELFGAHIAQLRRARQRLTGGLVLLSLLLVVAVVAGLIAQNQAAVAREQARVATARALASASAANLDDRLDLAQLLAVEAYRLDPGPRTRAALYQAVTAQPHLVHYLSAGARVTKVVGTQDAMTVVAGSVGGTVTAWTGEQRRRRVVGRLQGDVTDVAVNADGSVVAACSATRAAVWAGPGDVRQIPVPAGESGQLVAVSPSGRQVLLYSTSADPTSGSLTLFDRRTGRTIRKPAGWVGAMTLPTEETAVVLSEEGGWERRRLPGLALRAKGGIFVGNVLRENALSADGKRFAFVFGDVAFALTNGRMGVWKTGPGGNQDVDRPPLQAGTVGPRPSVVALSSDGSHSATVANGIIHVSAVGRAGAGLPAVTQLRGNAQVAQDSVAFLGRGDRLVSGAGSLVTEWDLRKVGRIGSAREVRVPTTCVACVENPVAMSPDGRQAAVAGTNALGIWLYPLSGKDRSGSATKGRRVVPTTWDEWPVLPMAWSPSDRRLYFIRPDSPVLESYDVLTGAITTHSWVTKAGRPVLLSVSPDSRRLLVIAEKAVTEIDLATGNPVRAVGLAHEVTDALTYGSSPSKDVAVDPAWRRASVIAGSHVLSVDLRTGRATTLPGGAAHRVSYEGGYLAVGRADGSVDLFDVLGTRRLRTVPQGRQAYGNYFALDPQGTLLAQYRDDGTVLLTDPRDGQPLGPLPLSTPFVSTKVSLQFTPDGKRLVVLLEKGPPEDEAEAPGVLQQWNMAPESWTSAACRTTGRDLTATEWRRYAGPQIPDDLRCARDRP
ncbi:MAG: TIR domain-containing protein [Streptomyces sp.]|nr:TIR domain-containing protein [Streptomyces sp.]NUP42058.1 TIR domain-containing protein [Streptomyces sp.]NUS78285.1 TIR domain-containing protein [Streptomyces sp.]